MINSTNSNSSNNEVCDNIIVLVCGNIGSGKSTILDYIQQHLPNVHTHKEALNDWNASCANGKTILENYYEKPHVYAGMLQSTIFISQLKSWVKARNKTRSVHVLERSFHDVLHVFAPTLVDRGVLDPKWISEQSVHASQIPHSMPDLVCWIDTDVTECLHRIKTRGRCGEHNITLAYLQDLKRHELNMLDMFRSKNIKVCVVDGNSTTIETGKQVLQLMKKHTQTPGKK